MSVKNILLTIVAIAILLMALIKGLATAWFGMKLLPAVGILLIFMVVCWLWGRWSAKS